jgi:hypothetical protein
LPNGGPHSGQPASRGGEAGGSVIMQVGHWENRNKPGRGHSSMAGCDEAG